MCNLDKLKELAMHWSRSDVACMQVEEFSDVSGTPLADALAMFGAANALDWLIERLEAAEARLDALAKQEVPHRCRENFIALCNQFWNWTEFDEINAGEEEPRLEWDGSAFTHRVTQSLWRMYQEAPSAPAVPVRAPDYFSKLVSAARERADKAMRKFPQPNYVLNKVAEESGEVIKAVIHYTEGREDWLSVEGELIDNLAMLIRLVTEGDGVIGFKPPEEVLRLNNAGGER